MLHFDEGIKKGLSDGEVLGNIIGNVDLITHGLGVGIELGSFDRFFGGSNDEQLEGLLLGDSLVSTDCKVIGSNEGIKLVSTDGNLLGTILGYVV